MPASHFRYRGQLRAGGKRADFGKSVEIHYASIVAKAEKKFPFSVRVLLPVRGMATRFLAHLPRARAAIAAGPKPLPRDLTPEYLGRALLGSLCRLRRERSTYFCWTARARRSWRTERLLDCLGAFKHEGLARSVGVSCDDQATLANIASDKRVDGIEAPCGPNRQQLLVALKGAAAIVIAREILARDFDVHRPQLELALSSALPSQ
jgi:hypothetical protein